MVQAAPALFPLLQFGGEAGKDEARHNVVFSRSLNIEPRPDDVQIGSMLECLLHCGPR